MKYLCEGCERLVAPAAVQLEGGVLVLGSVRVEGDTATAEVRTSAAGQDPSEDTVSLVKVDDGWRIASLVS